MKIEKIILGILFCMFIIFPSNVFAQASSSDYNVLPAKTNVDMNKEWKVKFNISLDPSTINEDNFKVKDGLRDIGLKVKADASDDKAVLIDLPTLGYVPGKSYTLYVGQGVKSKDGKNLSKPVKMDFKVNSEFKDGTSFESLPVVENFTSSKKCIKAGENLSFIINTKGTGKVQYRIYMYKYNFDVCIYEFNSCTELTSGYTSPQNIGKYIFTYNKNVNAGDYKVVVYAKRPSVKGSHEDYNTDFDNYSTCYFKCADTILQNTSKQKVEYKNYNITYADIIDKQYNSKSGRYSHKGYLTVASKNVVDYYMNPESFMDNKGKYMFMRLDSTLPEIKAEDLNKILKGKGTLEGMGQAFINAANKYKVNVAYLVAHAFDETAYGKSALASGKIKVNGKSTYNFFGIKAIDANPNGGGSSYANEQGWYTKEAAIEGGVKYISEKYIYGKDKFFTDRKTLYTMKWNPLFPASYQYATDVNWAYKISQFIYNNFKDILDKYSVTYEIPKYME